MLYQPPSQSRFRLTSPRKLEVLKRALAESRSEIDQVVSCDFLAEASADQQGAKDPSSSDHSDDSYAR